MVSNLDIEIQKLICRADRFAARLNPGLSAIAIVLFACLIAEGAIRFPALYAAELASNNSRLAIDPTALTTVDPPPF